MMFTLFKLLGPVFFRYSSPCPPGFLSPTHTCAPGRINWGGVIGLQKMVFKRGLVLVGKMKELTRELGKYPREMTLADVVRRLLN